MGYQQRPEDNNHVSLTSVTEIEASILQRHPSAIMRTVCPSVTGMPSYVLAFVAPCLIGLAVVVAVFRANKDDLPAIVRALMRIEPRDCKPSDGSGQPPSLPKL